MDDETNSDEIDLQAKLEKAQKEADKKDKKAAKNHDKEETKKLREELEQMTELAKRTMADLQNLKRRQEEERKVLVTMGNVDLIKQLLPVLDNLDRAKEHVPEGAEEWFKGLEISINQIHQIFDASGLTPIVCLGEKFNPDFHEALVQGPGEKDEIIEELEKGYLLGDRVIRHAKVKVGNGEK